MRPTGGRQDGPYQAELPIRIHDHTGALGDRAHSAEGKASVDSGLSSPAAATAPPAGDDTGDTGARRSRPPRKASEIALPNPFMKRNPLLLAASQYLSAFGDNVIFVGDHRSAHVVAARADHRRAEQRAERDHNFVFFIPSKLLGPLAAT